MERERGVGESKEGRRRWWRRRSERSWVRERGEREKERQGGRNGVRDNAFDSTNSIYLCNSMTRNSSCFIILIFISLFFSISRQTHSPNPTRTLHLQKYVCVNKCIFDAQAQTHSIDALRFCCCLRRKWWSKHGVRCAASETLSHEICFLNFALTLYKLIFSFSLFSKCEKSEQSKR